jgi:hypothetical protein
VSAVKIKEGDYLCSQHELYHVEHVTRGRALLEDCLSGELVDVPISELLERARICIPTELPEQAAPVATADATRAGAAGRDRR